MRAHVATCELIPQDRREDLQRFQEEKEHRQAIKKEHAEQLGAAGGGAPPKKVKRDHNGDVVIGSAASRCVLRSSQTFVVLFYDTPGCMRGETGIAALACRLSSFRPLAHEYFPTGQRWFLRPRPGRRSPAMVRIHSISDTLYLR